MNSSAQALSREARLADSARKIRPPFALDPTMRFYSPQENVDAFAHPRVAAWLDWLANEWEPPREEGASIAVLLPCTKVKPYLLSREHQAINAALLDAGWEPPAEPPPAGLRPAAGDAPDPRLLDERPLRRGGYRLDRIVVSEPLGLVPYTDVYSWRGEPSPCTGYDDPGLFESRGTSVSPWRADSTARRRRDGRWAWGPGERAAYLQAHDRLRAVIGAALSRVAPRYDAILAWVSPGLTHRSFLIDREMRRAAKLPLTLTTTDGPRDVTGVLDEHPGLLTVLPTQEHLLRAQSLLADRLQQQGRAHTDAAVRAIYARGDGHDTPLGLPETLLELIGTIDRHTG